MKRDSSNINNTNMTDRLTFVDFPETDYQTWRDEAESILQGAAFEKKMVSELYGGIKIQPIYTEKDTENLKFKNSYPGSPPFSRGNDFLGFTVNPWDIAQEISYPTIREFSDAITGNLKRGQTAIACTLDKATRRAQDPDRSKIGEVGRGGLSVSTIADIEALFKGIEIQNWPIFIKAGTAALPFAALFFAYVKKQGLDFARVRGCIGADPLGELALNGTLPISIDHAYYKMALLTDWAKTHAPGLKTISIDSHAWHNSGAGAVEELAFTIAAAVDYLRAMLDNNLQLDTAARRMRFTFSLGSRFFPEIAKLRAARILWAKIIEAFGGGGESMKMFIHARTSCYNKTVYDPHVNILRATTEAFSGILGGCDSLHVGYYEEAINQPDEFSRRIAGNIQIILQSESHADKVIDPAGGSWYVDKLTNEIALKSWELFQMIEAKGGMFEALKEGYPQQLIARTATIREKRLAKRKDVLIGTNMHPNLAERRIYENLPDYEKIYNQRLNDLKEFRLSINDTDKKEALEKLLNIAESSPNEIMNDAIDAALNGATIGEIAGAIRPDDFNRIDIYPVNIQRASEMFEIIRGKAEEYRDKTGSPPNVFLAKIGTVSQYSSRADFIAEFFQVGGFDIIHGEGHESIEKAAEAVAKSDSRVIVICSSDDNYSEIVGPLVKAIRKNKTDAIMVLAGYPIDRLDFYKEAGIDEFISSGANAYELLVRISQKIGVMS